MFTLRSLFALVTCIALILALLIPGIDAAREAARRMECSNNLKQLGLAFHNYHDVFKMLPPSFGVSNQLSWTVKIEPFAVSGPLFNRINQAEGPFHARGKNDPSGLVERWFHLCPSAKCNKMQLDPPNDVSLLDLVPPATGLAPYTIHYYGINGPIGPMPHRSGDYPVASPLMHEGAPVAGSGVFQWNTKVSLSSVIDGTSNTFCLGEMSWSSAKYGTRYRSWLNGGTDGSFVVGCRNIARPINSHKKTSVLKPFNNMSMGSEHRGGAQFAMLDGQVVFVDEGIDFAVYQLLSSRNGNEKLIDVTGKELTMDGSLDFTELKIDPVKSETIIELRNLVESEKH